MPINEREFVARVESADVEELARLLLRPSREEEKALRVYFGEGRYQRMHDAALRRSVSRGPVGGRGNVVVIHGIMGGELSVARDKGAGDRVWVHTLRLLRGWMERLRLDESGREEFDRGYSVSATGILKSHYGELLLRLSENWNVRAFWFDWRKDIRVAAAGLERQMSAWFSGGEPVHVVAHSMGGLVTRAFIRHYAARWRSMWDAAGDGAAGGRLVMLGTPYHGSYVIPQIMTGLEPMVRKLARYNFGEGFGYSYRHNLAQTLEVVRSFLGCYQMLPAPAAHAAPALRDAADALYRAETYGGGVPQGQLEDARQFQEELGRLDREADDGGRMIYVAGYNRLTPAGVKDAKRLDSLDGYHLTRMGDGRVTHELGVPAFGGRKIKTYYVDEDHGNLPANEEVIAALDSLLLAGETKGLAESVSSRAVEVRAGAAERAALEEQYRQEEKRVESLLRNLDRSRALSDDERYVLSDERRLQDELTRGFLSHRDEEARPAAARAAEGAAPGGVRTLEVSLVYGRIDRLDELDIPGVPVDAVAVGHYVGVRPVAAERALDEYVSRKLAGLPLPAEGAASGLLESDLIITQYTERGIIRGELGQPFFINEPPDKDAQGRAVERVVAVAGMGVPGYFGVPELKILARELSWSLGRLGKRHLVSVVIGTGNGNLSIAEAVPAYISGVRQSVTGAKEDEARHLTHLTFIELDPRKIVEIDQAIHDEAERLKAESRLTISYTRVDDATRLRLQKDAIKRARDEWKATLKKLRRGELAGGPRPAEPLPTRITFTREADAYHITAITESASIPERVLEIDPQLVEDANDRIAGEGDPRAQLRRGRVLEGLLVPQDLRKDLYTHAPVVIMLDSTTARVHWEMVAQSDPASTANPSADVSDDPRPAPGTEEARDEFKKDYFLGTCRGLTRQFRSTFAPPPEPPPPPVRTMRVLVVADPAADRKLPGAEAEGAEVADLFESFNTVYDSPDNRIVVTRLFGPSAASRINVLSELMLLRYDVLHFAGHCVYNAERPAASGWLFTGGELLTARELTRIDRVPKFVFSNACESGRTPDRAEDRSAALAPSFAEAFFARGVSNFVCTAWPVNDRAARRFALRLYEGMLGLKRADAADGDDPPPGRARGAYVRGSLEPMYVAMREARCNIAAEAEGARTWGAYQHYGKPNFRFFDPQTLGVAPRQTATKARKSPAAAGAKKAAKRAGKPGARKRQRNG